MLNTKHEITPVAGLTFYRQWHIWQTLSLLLSSGKPNPFGMRFILARLIFNALFEVPYSCAEGFGIGIRKNPSLRSTKSWLWKALALATLVALRLQRGERRGTLAASPVASVSDGETEVLQVRGAVSVPSLMGLSSACESLPSLFAKYRVH